MSPALPHRLVRLAVTPGGRRHAHALVVDDVASGALPPEWDDAIVVLDHAGPAAARWSTERPVGPDPTCESTTGRRPAPLDEDGWVAVRDAFARGAGLLRDRGRRPIVAVDDDGLLHACVSPLMCRPPCPQRVLDVVRACAPCDVLVVIEDLAPGGLDPTAGIALARALIAAAQATTLYATAGTVRLAPLSLRGKGAAVDDDGHFLASAAWCVGRVDVPVVAVGRAAVDPARAQDRARRLGMRGAIVLGVEGSESGADGVDEPGVDGA